MSDLFKSFGKPVETKIEGDIKLQENEQYLKLAKEALFDLPTGRRLVQILNSHNIPIKFIKGRDLDFSVPDGKTILLTIPDNLSNKINELALCLACGIRSVEHKMVGYDNEDLTPNTLEWKNNQASKMLDIIITMCKIGSEFKSVKGTTKIIDLIADLGHSDIYEAFVNKASYAELEKIMVKAMNKEKNEV